MRIGNSRRILLVIPLLILIVSRLVVNAIGPYDLADKYDPEYMELFNALSLLTSHAPVNLDHPGTTLHELGAAVILAKWAIYDRWFDRTPVNVSVFRHAEDYLRAINLTLNILISVALYFAARAVHRAAGSVVPAIALQVTYLLFWQPILWQGRVTPEPLLISIGYLLMMNLARAVWRREQMPWTVPAGAGAIFGIGIVTKLSFLPIASIVLLFRAGRRTLIFLAGCLSAGTLVVLPVIASIPAAARYYWKFFSHAGYYGAGTAGVASRSVLGANMLSIVQQEPFLVIFSLVYLLALLHDSFQAQSADRSPDRRMFRMVLSSGLIANLIEVALVAQHYRTHYLVPAIVNTGFVNAVMLSYYQARLSRPMKIPVVLCCVATILLGVVRTGSAARLWIQSAQMGRANYAKILEKLKAMPECTQIGYNYSLAPLSALHFGNGQSAHQQAKTLESLYPDSLTYSWQDGKMLSFSGEDETKRVSQLVANGRCVLLEGTVMPDKFALPSAVSYKAVVVAGNQGIYRLVENLAPVAAESSLNGPPNQNLSFGEQTAQSSTLNEPGKAVDGNVDGNYYHGSVSHTLNDENAWWQVDLGQPASIDKVVIWNRTDCCSERLINFWVFVSEAPFGESDSPEHLHARPLTWSSFQTDIPSPNLEVAVGGMRGRYVRVQLAGKAPLSLAEVQVYGRRVTAR